jgi:hypothetical protein
MDDALRQAGWICVVVAAAAYITFLFSDGTFNKAAPVTEPLVVRDSIRKHEHHLTGTVNLNSSCDQLSLEVKQVSQTVYELEFETWPDPAVICKRGPTPRNFDVVVFAPSVGVRFTATLDKNPLSIAVYPSLAK